MAKTWLLIDVSNLAHMAQYTTGSLSHEGRPTGVLYGVFRDVLRLRKTYDGAGFAFAFDSYHSLRREESRTYKANRAEARDQAFDEQLIRLRDILLKALGYNNILRARGYEADDVIASALQGLPPEDKAVIVSSDKDLWQCLRPGVCAYSPQTKKTYTHFWFWTKYGLTPELWADIKALAGCGTDAVAGIDGVGEATAARYLRNELPAKYKAYKAIAAGYAVKERNLPLVKLPYKGCPAFFLRPDTESDTKWREVLRGLGMVSLMKHLKGEGFGGRPRA